MRIWEHFKHIKNRSMARNTDYTCQSKKNSEKLKTSGQKVYVAQPSTNCREAGEESGEIISVIMFRQKGPPTPGFTPFPPFKRLYWPRISHIPSNSSCVYRGRLGM